MIWDIVMKKIEDANLAVKGQSLFLEEMAGHVSVGVLLKSPLSGIRIDWHMPGYHKTNLQVIVRHTDPVAGEDLANQIRELLLVEAPETYAATARRGRAQINTFYPVSLPIRYPRLEGGTLEWSLNFQTSFSIQAN